MHAEHLTLSGYLMPARQAQRVTSTVLLALLGSLLIAALAQVSVPFYPVPMTLQTLAVLAVGAGLGARLGAASVLLYLAEGAVGLPVFHNGTSGPVVLLGPTGGYLLGFVLAAALVGWFAERGADHKPARMFAAALLGGAILYVPGLAWLAAFTGAETALAVGLVPFLLGDLIKITVVALGFPAVRRLIDRRQET